MCREGITHTVLHSICCWVTEIIVYLLRLWSTMCTLEGASRGQISSVLSCVSVCCDVFVKRGQDEEQMQQVLSSPARQEAEDREQIKLEFPSEKWSH